METVRPIPTENETVRMKTRMRKRRHLFLKVLEENADTLAELFHAGSR